MTRDEQKKERIREIQRAAVSAVMRFGKLESSGAVKLAIFRKKDLMIAYRTPFNPLPPLSETTKYLAAKEGRFGYLLPYGIDIWQLDVGKVLSAGWRDGEPVVADLYRPGQWENILGIRAGKSLPKCGSAHSSRKPADLQTMPVAKIGSARRSKIAAP